MGSKNQVIKLYKSLLRESRKISAYNFRTFAIRKIRDSFRENKEVTDANTLQNLIRDGQRNLETIKRQALISQLYSTDKLVIENINK